MQIVDIDFCGIEDLDVLYAVECACFASPWKRYMLESDLQDLGGVVYLKAVAGGGIIAGYGVLSRNDRDSHLQNLAVLPEYRRLGVASQLMIGFDEISEEWGCMRMCLEVRVSNKIARDFYAKIGFSYHSISIGYYADGEDALNLTAKIPLRVGESLG
ncbi:MAG: GNAT family N-acetyltransferase [Synergistaceae bacterium]|jgi:ribosomal-protein-alanine N-acetyltransferase|nr:GNAT family N-acetyltransferase [Synergistaceae bacterium]